MRKPTPLVHLLAWHTAALSGRDVSIHDGIPECGWFKRRIIKGGPWVPVFIYVEREFDEDTGELADDEKLRCTVEGIDGGDPANHWTYLTPISKAEFDRLTDLRLRDSRFWDSRKAVDLSERPSLPLGAI